MKTFLISALLGAACAQDPPARPDKPLDPQDPQSLAAHAAYNTRTQQGYTTTFKARLAAPQGDPIDYKGTTVWISPGILYIHYTATGKELKNIVRAGYDKKGVPKVWMHHPFADWVTAQEAGNPGLARGIQNPDEILAALSRHLGAARLVQPGVVELTFTGDDIEKIMKDQASKGSFDWKKSSAKVTLHVDGATRLDRFVCEATLRSSDPNVAGEVRYSADIKVDAYNRDAELKFFDEKNKPVALDPEIRAAIENAKKEKR